MTYLTPHETLEYALYYKCPDQKYQLLSKFVCIVVITHFTHAHEDVSIQISSRYAHCSPSKVGPEFNWLCAETLTYVQMSHDPTRTFSRIN